MKIDFEKKFPQLPKAPIVEAAITIQARAQAKWEESTISKEIKARLPGYPKAHSRKEMAQELKFSGPGATPEATTHDLGWKGLRVKSQDDLQIAQFNRDGFVFSRLRPYENWENFTREAMRLWKIYLELARPTEIQRLSLRYINRIELPPKQMQLEDYVTQPPKPPANLELPFYGFFHQDILAVPGHDYAINLILTIQIQKPQDPGKQGNGLILDITVTTMQPFEAGQEALDKRLPEMRWLKNEVFFGSITQTTLNSFQC